MNTLSEFERREEERVLAVGSCPVIENIFASFLLEERRDILAHRPVRAAFPRCRLWPDVIHDILCSRSIAGVPEGLQPLLPVHLRILYLVHGRG